MARLSPVAVLAAACLAFVAAPGCGRARTDNDPATTSAVPTSPAAASPAGAARRAAPPAATGTQPPAPGGRVPDPGPPPAAPPHPAAGGPGGPDPAVGLVLGAESPVYQEFGYKGVTLGSPFDEVTKATPLKWTVVGCPWAFTSSNRAGGDEFVFDADRRLVCYARTYDGGPGDYLDQLVELFGKTDIEIRESTSANPDVASHRTFIDYTFPRVLVRVVFVREARATATTAVLRAEKTHVVVADRAWVEGLLDANAWGKRVALAWLRAAAEAVRDRGLDPAALAPIDGGVVRAVPKFPDVLQFADLGREAANRDRAGRGLLPAIFGGATAAPRPGDRRPPPVRLHIEFDRYTPLATPKVYRQDDPQRGVVLPQTGNNALAYTAFGNLVRELNAVLAQDVFPPKGDTVVRTRTAAGATTYEWRTRDGWLVRCRAGDAVAVEWVGERGL